MSLYKKYRPKSFRQIIGMKEVVKTLQKHTTAENPNRFLLFTGPSGTGKTTLARILAGEIGATELSIMERNSADHNGIDSVREIIKKSQTPSLDGAPMVWIIDEAHRITTAAQEAYLKVTEDIPENVWFIFCTTEKNKLIKALTTRPMVIKTRNLKDEELTRLLNKVAAKEDIAIEKALPLILSNSGGSPRMALNHLEAFQSSGDLKSIQAVSDESAELIELARSVLKNSDWTVIAAMLKKLEKDGHEAETVRRVIAGYMKAVLLNGKYNKKHAFLLECFHAPVYDTGWNGLILCCCVARGE